MTLEQFIDADGSRDRTLVVVNREAPRPFQRLLEDVFTDQPVAVDEAALSDAGEDEVFLLDGDGSVLATSTLQALGQAILLVNSDLYITGARRVDDLELPAVVEQLAGVTFTLRGYPAADKEKLLLITISRYVEGMALAADGGTLRASFQRLSRIDDEVGTRRVYERLAAAGTDTHVYGMPDWTPPPEFDVTMHGGWSPDFRDSWFVVHVPADEADRHAALLAVETDPGVWTGFWTFEDSEVREIDQYVRNRL